MDYFDNSQTVPQGAFGAQSVPIEGQTQNYAFVQQQQPVPDQSYGWQQDTLDAKRSLRNLSSGYKWASMTTAGAQFLGAGAYMAFDTFDGNDSGMLDDANDAIVVTSPGAYHIVCQTWCGNGGLVEYGNSIMINGAQKAIQFGTVATGISRVMSNVTWVGFLNAGDVIKAYCYGGTSEAGTDRNWLKVFQIT